jgi:hypothetical protein
MVEHVRAAPNAGAALGGVRKRGNQKVVEKVLRRIGPAHVGSGRRHAAREWHKEAPGRLVLKEPPDGRVPGERLDPIAVPVCVRCEYEG